MKKTVLTILGLGLSGCAAHKSLSTTVPTCGAELLAPKGCVARAWGNGVEVDCPDGAKIYYCQKLPHASPRGSQ